MNPRGGRRRLRAQRMYRRLVRLYPAAHRRAFGEQMVQAFGDHYRDAVEAHGRSRLRFWVAVLADAGTSIAAGHLGTSVLVSGLLVMAWLGYGMRLARRVPAGPHGDGPAPPGGAGVREPRRPLPMSPAGAAARPVPTVTCPGGPAP